MNSNLANNSSIYQKEITKSTVPFVLSGAIKKTSSKLTINKNDSDNQAITSQSNLILNIPAQKIQKFPAVDNQSKSAKKLIN